LRNKGRVPMPYCKKQKEGAIIRLGEVAAIGKGKSGIPSSSTKVEEPGSCGPQGGGRNVRVRKEGIKEK